MNTCDKCKHFTAPDLSRDWVEPYQGECALALNYNDHGKPDARIDRVMGWDGEECSAGVYVGPKFGCIHWEGKE